MDFRALPQSLVRLSRPFAENGHALYLVGGAVRDNCLGKRNSDYDFATDATPQEVMRLFRRVAPTGLKHGTVTVLFEGGSYEVTTFRCEADYSDHRHPAKVGFVKSLEEDLKRRDFTINALAVRLPSPEIIDLCGGLDDLRARTIRCIGAPEERFGEDALRMMRACRFSAALDFGIERGTFLAIQAMAPTIDYVSKERIQEELSKTLLSPSPRRGLQALSDSGLLDRILPDLAACRGVGQGDRHREDVFQHSLSALDIAASKGWSLPVRLAALLHDVGKPACRAQAGPDAPVTFYGHDAAGAGMARRILKGLKYPNAVVDKVAILIRNHMFNYTPAWTDGAVRRFVLRCGEANVEDVLRLRLADALAMTPGAAVTLPAELADRIARIESPGLTVNDLALGGADLIAMGLEPGPLFKEIKEFLLQQVLDRPELNNKADLGRIARGYLEGRKG